MVEILRRSLKICLLSHGPQDLPHSQRLLQLMLLVYLVSGCISMWPMINVSKGILVMLVDLIVLLSFSLLCLNAFNKTSRFIQTITALTAVGAIFQLLVWPLMLYVNEFSQGETVPVEASLLLLIIISWNLAVYAHIFRQAFEVRSVSSFALTIAYVVVNMSIRSLLFPDLGV